MKQDGRTLDYATPGEPPPRELPGWTKPAARMGIVPFFLLGAWILGILFLAVLYLYAG